MPFFFDIWVSFKLKFTKLLVLTTNTTPPSSPEDRTYKCHNIKSKFATLSLVFLIFLGVLLSRLCSLISFRISGTTCFRLSSSPTLYGGEESQELFGIYRWVDEGLHLRDLVWA